MGKKRRYPKFGIDGARTTVPGEKPLLWVGSTKRDLLHFPELVRNHGGIALSVARFGGKHPAAKPWKGEGAWVLEIVTNLAGDTWRAVYTVRFEKAVYVLHVFQKNRLRELDGAARR